MASTALSFKAPSRRRLTAVALAAAAGMAAAAHAQNSPQGGQVVAGSANVNQNGALTQVTASNGAIINWQSFNIGQGHTVQFVQPGATSRVLNRITGADPSTISGNLNANGIVYIVNPAGVIFTPTAVINVGGMYAAAGSITSADFLNNVNRFTSGQGSVENHGTINAHAVHLIGQRVANYGVINSPGGMVTMAAGDEVMVGEQGGQIFARVSGAPASGGVGVTQAGEINARGGQVRLGAGDLYAMAIDHPGRTVARDITLQGGRGGEDIAARGGVVSVSGTLDASNQGDGLTGGTVKVLGDRVGLFGSAYIDVSGDNGGGTALVGGNRQGVGPETNASATYVSPDAHINADANVAGDGGSVVVWSDVTTRAFGTITARGGEQSGNGGFIETSGKKELELYRAPDASARSASGRGGLWLIDPEDLTIVAGNGSTNINVSGTTVFTSTGTPAELGVDLITGALTGGASVEVRTGATGPASGGVLTLDTGVDIDYNGTGDNTLSLFAHRRIVLNGRIYDSDTNTADSLNLNLSADIDGNGTGNILVNEIIETNGGTFTVLEGVDFITAAAISTGGGDFSVNLTGTGSRARLGADIDAGSGSIEFFNPIILNEDVVMSGGNITLAGANSGSTARSLDLNLTGGGLVTLGGDIGDDARLFRLRTNAQGSTLIDAASINARFIDFGNPVELGTSTVLSASASTVFRASLNSQSGEANDLTIDAPVANFNGQVGAASGGELGALLVKGGESTLNLAALRAATVEFQSAITLAFNAVITATTSATFASIDSRAGEARSLTVNSPLTTFGGVVGGGDDGTIGTITTDADGTTHINTGSMAAAVLNFQDSVVLGASSVLNGSTSITFGGTLDSTAGQGFSLTLNSPATLFSGNVGQTTEGALGTLSTDAAGTTTIDAALFTANEVIFGDAVVIGRDLTLSAANLADFQSTINSESGEANDLILNSRDFRVAQAIGGQAGGALGFLQTDAAGVSTISGEITADVVHFRDSLTFSGGSITTTSDQVYDGNVTLGSETVFTGANITFQANLDSDSTDRGLTLTATGGDINFGGAVGSVNPLASLAMTADGRIFLDGGYVATSGNQVYNSPVTVVSNTTIFGNDITFNETVDSSPTPRSLSITMGGGGTTTFARTVGAAAALQSLIVSDAGTTRINGGSVTTLGTQAYNNAVILGDNTTLNGGGVAFGGTLDSSGTTHALNVNTTGGLTAFNGAVGQTVALNSITINSGGTTQIVGPTVRTIGDQTYGNAVVLGGDVAITGRHVRFESTIDSIDIGSPFALSVSSVSNGVTHFLGEVGGISPLRSITTDAAGTTRIGANMTTSGGTMTFNDTVLLTNDVVLTDTGGSGISFAGALDSEGSARALTLLINTGSNATVSDPSIARINFGGNVGANMALASLTLGGDRATPATAATITAGLSAGAPIPDYSLVIYTIGDFTMGVGQKMSVLGNLAINAGSATLSDISTLGSLAVNASSIAIQMRPAGVNLFASSESNNRTLIAAQDIGVDFVAGGRIDFSVAPTLLGSGPGPSFGTDGAVNISSNLLGFAQRDVGQLNANIFFVNALVLDLASTGPSNANVAEAIAGALPSESQYGYIFEDTAVGVAMREELAQLGIAASEVEARHLADYLSGRAFYDDAASAWDPAAPGYTVTINRLPASQVRDVLAAYRIVFVRDGRNNAEHVRGLFAAAWDEYSNAVGGQADPLGFRAYCEAVPAQTEAVYYMDSIRDLFSELSYLGLAPAELRASKRVILRAVAVPGLTAEQLEATITATNLGVALK